MESCAVFAQRLFKAAFTAGCLVTVWLSGLVIDALGTAWWCVSAPAWNRMKDACTGQYNADLLALFVLRTDGMRKWRSEAIVEEARRPCWLRGRNGVQFEVRWRAAENPVV